MIKLNINDKMILDRMSKNVLTERRALKELLETLQIIYDQKIYAKLGHSSIVKFLIKEYHYSESAAYRRYKALKLVQEIPSSLNMLADGSLSLSNAANFTSFTLGATDAKKQEVLQEIQFKTTDEASKSMFNHFPEKEISKKPTMKRIAEDKINLNLQLNNEEFLRFKNLKARLKITDNNQFLKELLNIADEKLNKPIKEKSVKTSKYQRHIPAPIKREIMKMASYQCEYKNCGEKNFLELDHIRPIKTGGMSSLDNLRVLCRTHNQLRI